MVKETEEPIAQNNNPTVMWSSNNMAPTKTPGKIRDLKRKIDELSTLRQALEFSTPIRAILQQQPLEESITTSNPSHILNIPNIDLNQNNKRKDKLSPELEYYRGSSYGYILDDGLLLQQIEQSEANMFSSLSSWMLSLGPPNFNKNYLPSTKKSTNNHKRVRLATIEESTVVETTNTIRPQKRKHDDVEQIEEDGLDQHEDDDSQWDEQKEKIKKLRKSIDEEMDKERHLRRQIVGKAM